MIFRNLLKCFLWLSVACSLGAQITSYTARHIYWGASVPAICNPTTGDVFFKTQAPSLGVYYCSATNTWTYIDPAGGGGAPTNAEYVVLTLDGTLSDERVLTGGTAITLADGGAGGNATLNCDAAVADGATPGCPAFNATRFSAAAGVVDVASVAGVTGANEDDLSDDTIAAHQASTSADLLGVLSDEIGTGVAVFASGTPDGTKFLRDDGTWQAAGGSTLAFGTVGSAVADTSTDTLTITDSLSIDLTTTNDPEDLTAAFLYTGTLAGNLALGAEECVFSTDGTSGGGFLCEGTTGGNTNEQLYLFPAVDGVDTTNFIVVDDKDVRDIEGVGLAVTSNTLNCTDAAADDSTKGCATFDATRFSAVSGNVDIASVAGITGADEDNLADDAVTALSTYSGTSGTGSTALLSTITTPATGELLSYSAGGNWINQTLAELSIQPLDAALTALAGGSDFVQFTGPLTSTKIFTLPNSAATLLYSGGALGIP
ncbi:MAG: autotransporter outer membrane beta-barrel domain-containing protein, partial [Planctomycetota bacterium]